MKLELIISIASVSIALFALFVAFWRNRWMARQTRLSSAIAIVNWLEEVRPHRSTMYKIRDEEKPLSSWTPEEKDAANKVARSFDILGLLDSLKYTEQKFVDRFYAIPAHECAEILREWIGEERKVRDSHHLWEFEQLALRVQHVKPNHPAVTGKTKWLRNSRKA